MGNRGAGGKIKDKPRGIYPRGLRKVEPKPRSGRKAAGGRGLIDGDISASAGRAGDGVADDWVTRDFADYEQAAGGLGVGEENQVLLGKGGIGDVKVFAHPVKVAAGAAGNEAIGKRLLGAGNLGNISEIDFGVNPGSAAHFV